MNNGVNNSASVKHFPRQNAPCMMDESSIIQLVRFLCFFYKHMLVTYLFENGMCIFFYLRIDKLKLKNIWFKDFF
jgi:hypothetical protein